MQIFPIDREWLNDFILQPYEEGCGLIDQFWKGVDHSLSPNSLKWTDRIICLIQGTALMIPLVNTIIWIAWQTFGDPERFADPFCPEIDTPIPDIIPEIIVHKAENEAENLLQEFRFHETQDGKINPVTLTIEKRATTFTAIQNSSEFSSYATYDQENQIKELHFQKGSKTINFSLDPENHSQLKIEIKDAGMKIEKSLPIPQDGCPWIQQRALGLKPFILSNKQEMEFHFAIPEYPPIIGWLLSWLVSTPFIMKAKAKKMGEEKVAGFGSLLKIEVCSTWRWPYNTAKSELWFDPKTGILKKFIDSGTYISEKVGVLVQSNQ